MKSDLIAPLALPVFLLLAQCSPVAPPLARGSAKFEVKKPSNAAPGTDCRDFSPGGIGNPPPEVANTLSEMDLHREGMVVHGSQSTEGNTPYEISCKITGSGDLAIEGTLKGPNTHPSAEVRGSGNGITFMGTLGTNLIGTGQVSFNTTGTGAVTPKDNTTCELSATPTPLMACSNLICLNGQEPADYGGLAITFFCPDMNMANVIDPACEGRGTIVVDRCTY